MKTDWITDELDSVGRNLFGGLKINRVPLGFPSSIDDPALQAFNAFLKKNQEFYASESYGITMIATALKTAHLEAEDSINGSKKVLRLKLSEQWSDLWKEPGFRQGSSKTPTSAQGRVTLLGDLAQFFAKHPDFNNEPWNLTSEVFASRADALKNAIAAAASHNAQHKTLSREREQLATRLRGRLRAIVKELEQSLASDDPRWAEFGLDTPAASRAAKPTRDKKAKEKSASHALKRIDAARDRAEAANVSSEKLRVRAARALEVASRLQAEADQAAAKVAAAFAKVDAMITALAPGDSAIKLRGVGSETTTADENETALVA